MKAIQYFSAEYLQQCRQMTPDQIVSFLEDFRRLHGQQAQTARSKLISLKVPEDLLHAFRIKAKLNNLRYQTQIKTLMREWLSNEG